ncbi:MAG: S41 family peptidase [Treponema sp.]|jgi:carboxyl-terminal processing protease|nr:S41 family peptidase [Treponema sp.]
MNNTKWQKPFLSWVWFVATAVICVLLSFVMVPEIPAQGNGQSVLQGTTQIQQNRKYYSIIQNVFNFIQNHYVEEIDPQVIFEGAMSGMFNALEDPYSSFLSESDMKDMNDTTQGNFGGVGLNIIKASSPRPDGKPMWVEVTSPIEDTPGWRAGINPGDFITEINGTPTETITMDEVLSLLRGTPGEDVKLMIRRGEKMEFPITITRAIIEVPTAKYAMIGDTGYLKLLTFTPMTASRARDAVNEFKTKNFKSLILDLRNNYGGLLNSAVDVCSLFLDGGLVVRTRSRIPSENNDFNAKRGNLVPADIPVIVLINRGSASASEIVAGALKDRGRAYLVGEKSFGKGSVQQVYPLEDSGFKITTAHYYTPSDVNINKIGIPPDREVKFPEYTEEDAVKMNELINANKIPEFAGAYPKADAGQVEAFAKTLEKEYHIDLSLLKRMIRNELNRTSFAPVYDLEYDIQLQSALDIIRGGTYPQLMKNYKTLKTLQEEAEVKLPLAS